MYIIKRIAYYPSLAKEVTYFKKMAQFHTEWTKNPEEAYHFDNRKDALSYAACLSKNCRVIKVPA